MIFCASSVKMGIASLIMPQQEFFQLIESIGDADLKKKSRSGRIFYNFER